MTKTFTTTKGEYLLVEVPEKAMPHVWPKIMSIDKHGDHEIISLLKDITEEQAKEITCDSSTLRCVDTENLREHESLETWIEVLHSDLRSEGIDTSLNWLLLKKI